MRFFLIFILLALNTAQAAAPSVCDIIDSASCYGVTKQSRRASTLSFPSPAAAASINPATVSFDKGLGIEAIAQPKNEVAFNFASGTGKMGGALISHSLENSFFGNRVPEVLETHEDRLEDKQQYTSKKLNLALGRSIIRRKSFILDLGLMAKRHSEIKKINLGAGVSGRIGPITFGASTYRDDFRLEFDDYATDPYTGYSYWYLYPDKTYTETFSVQTYSLGTRIRNLSLDAGVIKTNFDWQDDDQTITLYSAGLTVRSFLFNLGRRREYSKGLEYRDGEMQIKRTKYETYAGVQASVNKHIILGVQYNFFLLRETSFTGTLFF